MRNWDLQLGRNWWLSIGFSFDHTGPSLTLHLPGIIVAFGRLWQPGLRGAGSFLGLQRDNTGFRKEPECKRCGHPLDEHLRMSGIEFHCELCDCSFTHVGPRAALEK